MTKERDRNVQPDKSEHQPHRVHLPGFLRDEEVGLGEVVKRVTAAFGVRPCGSCEQRASLLNQWLVFTGRRPRS